MWNDSGQALIGNVIALVHFAAVSVVRIARNGGDESINVDPIDVISRPASPSLFDVRHALRDDFG